MYTLKKPPQDSQKDESSGFFDHMGARSFIHKKTIKTGASVAAENKL